MTIDSLVREVINNRALSANYIMRSPSSFPANTYLHRAHFHCARSSGSNIRHGPLLYRLRRPISNGAKPLPPNKCNIVRNTQLSYLSLSFFYYFCNACIFRAHYGISRMSQTSHARTRKYLSKYYRFIGFFKIVINKDLINQNDLLNLTNRLFCL